MFIFAEGEELLTGLQIPSFLKFVQTRQPEKLSMIYTEKVKMNITSFLTFSYSLWMIFLKTVSSSVEFFPKVYVRLHPPARGK